jgi:diacylglycerol kinase
VAVQAGVAVELQPLLVALVVWVVLVVEVVAVEAVVDVATEQLQEWVATVGLAGTDTVL